jgi:hypothetical protein
VHGVVVRAPVVQLYCVQHFGQRGHYAVGTVACPAVLNAATSLSESSRFSPQGWHLIFDAHIIIFGFLVTRVWSLVLGFLRAHHHVFRAVWRQQ